MSTNVMTVPENYSQEELLHEVLRLSEELTKALDERDSAREQRRILQVELIKAHKKGFH